MAIFSIKNICIRGLSVAVPKQEYDNNNYTYVNEKERRLMIKTTGVQTRRIAPRGLTTGDLCYYAAEQLIKELRWKKQEIQAIVLITQTADYLIPSSAIILQDRLGLPKSSIAFDINLGCSGYVYGLYTIASLMINGNIKKGLLAAGDISTWNASYKDKSTYPLFGDAGSITALEFTQNATPMYFNLQSDGSGYKALYVKDGGMRNFVDPIESFKYKKYGEGIIRNNIQIALDGIEIFNFSLREVAPNINTLLHNFSLSISDFDYFIFHQANRLINESIRKKLKIPPEKFLYSIHKYGNTSSASIPLTISYNLHKEIYEKELFLLLTGFGIGLSWGSLAVKTSKVVCPEIIDCE